MAGLSVRHLAGDRFAIRIRGHEVVVDQPFEAGGDDTAPTPTELFVGSLAACAAFYARRFVRRHGVADGELSVECDYAMSTEPPGRVTGITVRLTVARELPDEIRAGALRAADQCTVKNSIRYPVDIDVSLRVAEPSLARRSRRG